MDVRKASVEWNAREELVPSFKRSQAGRLTLVQTPTSCDTVRQELRPEVPNLLQTVFANGHTAQTTTFETIRDRVAVAIPGPNTQPHS